MCISLRAGLAQRLGPSVVSRRSTACNSAKDGSMVMLRFVVYSEASKLETILTIPASVEDGRKTSYRMHI